jgi:DNA-binding MltR family transcriptional regulator
MPETFDAAKITKNPIWKELSGQSDRTAAVVSTALLEDTLSSAIRARFREDKEISHSLLKPGGPLGGLGPKANLGYLLSMYSIETLQDIKLIAEIRNKFAHRPYFTDFKTKEIRAVCGKITVLRRYEKAAEVGWDKLDARKQADARLIFTSACLIMSQVFVDMTKGELASAYTGRF